MALSRSALAQSFLKYALAGGCGAVVDFGILMLCYRCVGWHYLAATACGFITGCVFVYALCNAWVFARRKLKGNPATEFGVFALIGVVGLLLTQGLMWLLVDGAGLLVPLAKCGTMVVVFIWNFGARKWILY